MSLSSQSTFYSVCSAKGGLYLTFICSGGNAKKITSYFPASRGSGRSVQTAISRLGSSPNSRRGSERAFDDGISVAASVWSSRFQFSVKNDNISRQELRPNEVASKMKAQINALLDETAALTKEGKALEAMDRAKDAVKKEDSLRKYRKEHSLSSEGQVELLFAVCFNVASCYQMNDLLDESVNAYTQITKQREHPLAGRARINLGNIHYSQHDYPAAIKMYKMALDLLPQGDRTSIASVRCNIGNAYFRQGQLRDAVKNYEESMNANPNHQAGFNLLVCHLALGDAVNAQADFMKLLKVQPDSVDEKADLDDASNEDATRQDAANRILLSAARLIAPLTKHTELIETLKDHHEQLAMKIEYEQAVDLLKNNDLKRAVKKLETLAKHSPEMKAVVATNLSFVHLLQGDVSAASEYADTALEVDRYNAKALVNKGNCFFVNEDYASAKNMYLEAIGVEADCAQAIFNLGLSNVRLDRPDEAIRVFEKLHTVTPNSPTAIYHIADVHENQGRIQDAIRWLNILAAGQSSDSIILARLAHLYAKTKDDSQELHHNLESYRHFPVELDVISRIGAFFVQQEMFEKAIYFFKQAALVQPKEVKWSLMVASAHRRLGNHAKAFALYKKLHHLFPTNVECEWEIVLHETGHPGTCANLSIQFVTISAGLRSLVMLCKTIREPYHQYQDKLERLIEV